MSLRGIEEKTLVTVAFGFLQTEGPILSVLERQLLTQRHVPEPVLTDN